MAFWSNWQLPEIIVWAIIALILVFILAIIFWVITAFRNLPDTEEERSAGEEMVVSCTACQSNIEVFTSQRPARVVCAECGNEVLVR